jgi:DNA-binding transcriptional LysR family regulator
MIASGDIVPLFDLQLTTPQHAYYLVYERNVRERPEVNLLMDWMRTRFSMTLP